MGKEYREYKYLAGRETLLTDSNGGAGDGDQRGCDETNVLHFLRQIHFKNTLLFYLFTVLNRRLLSSFSLCGFRVSEFRLLGALRVIFTRGEIL